MDLSTTTRTASESYDDSLAADRSGVFQFNGIFVSLYIHMEHLFEDAFIQHLLRSAGVDFRSCVDGNDPVTVRSSLLSIILIHILTDICDFCNIISLC